MSGKKPARSGRNTSSKDNNKSRSVRKIVVENITDFAQASNVDKLIVLIRKTRDSVDESGLFTASSNEAVYKAIYDGYLKHLEQFNKKVDVSALRVWVLQQIAEQSIVGQPLAKKAKLFDRASYTPFIDHYGVIMNERSWKDACLQFNKLWECCNAKKDRVDYVLEDRFKSKFLYNCFCTCQKGVYLNNNHDPKLIIIRLHCPEQLVAPFLYKVSIRDTLVHETYAHFIPRANAIVRVNRKPPPGENAIAHGHSEDRTHDDANQKQLPAVDHAENNDNNDNMSQASYEQKDVVDEKYATEGVSDSIFADEVPDKGILMEEQASKNDNDATAIANSMLDNILVPSPSDLAKLTIDISELKDKVFEGSFLVIEEAYAKDKEECKRLEDLNLRLFKREFDSTARPSISAIGEIPELTESLRDLFFNPNGSVKYQLQEEDGTVSFITFDIPKIKDKRLMYSIKNNEDDSSIFQNLKRLLGSNKIINFNEEEMYDVSILIGGTMDQKVHYDNPRMYGGYRSKKKGKSGGFISGHEINRQMYNHDLNSPIGPASMIFDLTKRKFGINLGVLEKFVIQDSEGRAKIKCGKCVEDFRLVSTDHPNGPIININGVGVIFAGDFPHFGVRQVGAGAEEEKLSHELDQLFIGLPKKVTPELYGKLESIENLHEFSRLFLKVKPKTNKFHYYHFESVGTPEMDFKDYPL